MLSISSTIPSFSEKTFLSRKNSVHLSDLLPYEEKNIYKALVEYSLLLKAMLGTIEALEKGDIPQFDALVCENHCTTRAYVNAKNVESCSRTLIPKKPQVLEALKGVEGLMQKQVNRKLMFPLHDCDNFKALLVKEKLDICLNEEERLFVEFFLLTFVKESTIFSEKTNLKNLNNLVLVSHTFRDELIAKLRIGVSNLSAPLLKSLAFANGDTASLKMLDNKYIRIINNRSCPPYYPAITVVWTAMLINEIPVVLWIKQIDEDGEIIKQFCIYYEADPSKTSYEITNPRPSDGEKPVIMIVGISIRDGLITPNEVKRHNIELYLKCHAATHRHYPPQIEVTESKDDESLAEMTNNPKFQKEKKRAYKLGCTKDNPRLLYLCHTYCDLLKNCSIEVMDEYLKTRYGDYKKWFSTKKIKEIGKDCDLDLDVVPTLDSYDFWSRCYKLCRSNFLLESTLPGEEDRSYYWNYLTDWKDTYINPLELSQNYGENPIKFLMDHRSDWLAKPDHSFIKKPANLKEIIEFITEKPEHFQEPEVMNFLADLAQAPPSDRFCNIFELDAVMGGIEKALHVPEVKDQALRLLLHAGSQYNFIAPSFDPKLLSHYFANYQVQRRSAARKALKNFIEKPYIRKRLKIMVIEEPVVKLKMELLNMLDGYEPLVNEFDNGKIIPNLSSTWNIKDFIYHENHAEIRENTFDKLLDLIQDETRDRKQRIVAIRYLSNYFFPKGEFNLHEYYSVVEKWGREVVVKEYPRSKENLLCHYESLMERNSADTKDPSRLLFRTMTRLDSKVYPPINKSGMYSMELLERYMVEKLNYCKKSIIFLLEFIKTHPLDSDLRSEASSLLFMMKNQLDSIGDRGSFFKEIESLLEQY